MYFFREVAAAVYYLMENLFFCMFAALARKLELCMNPAPLIDFTDGRLLFIKPLVAEF